MGQAAEEPKKDANAVSQLAQNSTANDQDVRKTEEGQPAADTKKERDSSDHKLHVRLGTISVGAGYTHISGPAYYPYSPYYYPYDWAYGPMFWGPFWGPYAPWYGPGYFSYGDGKGEVRLNADPKTAQVYIDNAYAGTADHLKSMWLEPGAYDLSVSAKDHETFQQRIYVLSGKSLKIAAKLAAVEAKEKP
jgi:hypothetical protein